MGEMLRNNQLEETPRVRERKSAIWSNAKNQPVNKQLARKGKFNSITCFIKLSKVHTFLPKYIRIFVYFHVLQLSDNVDFRDSIPEAFHDGKVRKCSIINQTHTFLEDRSSSKYTKDFNVLLIQQKTLHSLGRFCKGRLFPIIAFLFYQKNMSNLLLTARFFYCQAHFLPILAGCARQVQV